MKQRIKNERNGLVNKLVKLERETG